MRGDVMKEEFPKKFPLTLDEKLYKLISKAAFATGKSKHQYCLDTIRKQALIDSQKIIIKREDD
jgi:uncharacterized protein (DUF1778 family)